MLWNRVNKTEAKMVKNVLKEILPKKNWWSKSIQSWDESFSKEKTIELHSLRWTVNAGRFIIKDKICEKFTMFSKEQIRYIEL
jgi:superfamily I DNA and/or RNA helicase